MPAGYSFYIFKKKITLRDVRSPCKSENEGEAGWIGSFVLNRLCAVLLELLIVFGRIPNEIDCGLDELLFDEDDWVLKKRLKKKIENIYFSLNKKESE